MLPLEMIDTDAFFESGDEELFAKLSQIDEMAIEYFNGAMAFNKKHKIKHRNPKDYQEYLVEFFNEYIKRPLLHDLGCFRNGSREMLVEERFRWTDLLSDREDLYND